MPNKKRPGYDELLELFRGPFPDCRFHHMQPLVRHGEDSEFNIFPWKFRPHSAWHKIFLIMTVQEVWPILEEAHFFIFEAGDRTLVREWCLPYRYHVRRDIQKDIETPKTAEFLQRQWVRCFGSADLRDAERVVRYMMLFMVFGRHGDRSLVVYDGATLRRLMADLPDTGPRNWAFLQCFGRPPGSASLRSIKKTIRRVRMQAYGLVHR